MKKGRTTGTPLGTQRTRFRTRPKAGSDAQGARGRCARCGPLAYWTYVSTRGTRRVRFRNLLAYFTTRTRYMPGIAFSASTVASVAGSARSNMV